MDLITISAALTSLRAITDLARNANDAQLAMKISGEIATIQGKLIDVQQQALSLQEENQGLRDEIRRLKASSEDEKSFEFKYGVYWKTYFVLTDRVDEDGERIHEFRYAGPFCPLCKDVDGKTVHLTPPGGFPKNGTGLWWCEVHKTEYKAPKRD